MIKEELLHVSQVECRLRFLLISLSSAAKTGQNLLWEASNLGDTRKDLRVENGRSLRGRR